MTKNEVSARVHRWLSYLYGAILVFALLYFVFGSSVIKVADVLPSVLFFCVLVAIHFFTSVGAQKKEPWARGASIVLGILMLFGFPIGTILGIVLLSNSNWNET
ncbi:hypothetical protein ACO0LL_10185 [Undibacterium sp. TC4M20W]|uniref:hypothetical protein n=1 Tax=Undibacterium sp. TC4M20W TaxID=3413052 RepID=UPI003BF016C6